MDGGKNPQAKTEPKERNFCFLTFGSAGFFRKIGSDREKVEKFVCLLRAPFPLYNFGGGSRGCVRVCVLFVEVFPLFLSYNCALCVSCLFSLC